MRDTGNVRLSCYACKIERSTAVPSQGAGSGVRPVVGRGGRGCHGRAGAEARRRAKKQSDTLIIFLLKSLRPAKYRETTRVDLAILKAPNEQLIDLVLGDGAELAAGEAAGGGGAEAPGPWIWRRSSGRRWW